MFQLFPLRLETSMDISSMAIIRREGGGYPYLPLATLLPAKPIQEPFVKLQ